MKALGIHYDSELSALRRIRQGGGLVALWTAGMALSLIPETDDLQLGDAGIIRSSTACGSDEVTAIYTGERWASLGVRGLDFGPAVPLRAWRL